MVVRCGCVGRLASYEFRKGFVVGSCAFLLVFRCGCVGRLLSYELRTGFVMDSFGSVWCFSVVV